MAGFIDNKRILKNSMFLYIRMFVLMIVGFVTVRIVLKALGMEDYGIYNVVGGIVAMFQFVQGSMTTASQRFLSIELANGTKNSLRRVFSLNVTVYLLFALTIVVAAESIGLWFLNNKLIIPASKIYAANVVYQLSLIAFVLNMLAIPYNALIVAYEKMSAFSWIGVVEGFSKLVVAIIILYFGSDKLVLYAILMAMFSFVITAIYISYCNRNFNCSKYFFYWNNKDIRELFSFSGWHFLGTFSVVVRSNGINLLINMFFNPVVNAARAIGYQIEHTVSQFSNNYFTAVKPQMYKAYSAGEYENLFKLINRSTILSMFLISIFLFPLIINLEFVLKIWLGQASHYTIAFGSLALINCLIDASSSPTIAPALAHGKIRNFEIAIATVAILNLPISYMALKLGYQPQITVVISIMLSIVAAVVRVLFLKKMMAFPIKPFLLILVKTYILSVLIYFALKFISIGIENEWMKLIITSFVSCILVVNTYLFILAKKDRNSILNLVMSKLK